MVLNSEFSLQLYLSECPQKPCVRYQNDGERYGKTQEEVTHYVRHIPQISVVPVWGTGGQNPF